MTEIHHHPETEHHHDEHQHHHEGEHGHHHHDHAEANIFYRLAEVLHLPGFAHDHSQLHRDSALHLNNLAIRTTMLALFGLGLTTILQIAIYLASNSVALLADTVHNLGDSLNSIPLLLAFMLARRLPDRRYTYGFGRAEDLAGVLIVLSIAFSAGYILVESLSKLLNPEPISQLPWVALAAIVGFLGNEFVAVLQIRVGRQISSEAMIADGLHARTDGFTSLAVLLAVLGTWLGFPIIDPIIGILIGIIIVGITWGAARAIWYRLMDAVDPHLMEITEATLTEHSEVLAVQRLQLRWVGHQLYGETVVQLQKGLSPQGTEELIHHLLHHFEHALPNLGHFTIQVSYAEAGGG
jgi:cation diffusion facilitator family transporter